MIVGLPQLRGTVGAASSTNRIAAHTAMSVLDRGGNAFDAAAAAGFVLQIVEPHYNGPGGDAAILAYPAATGKVAAICGQGPTPAAATIDQLTALGLHEVPGSGLLAACVPGAFGAWMRLLAEYGTLPLSDILGPAIGYAADGFPLLPETAHAIEILEPLFATEWTESGRVYLPGGRPPAPGSRFRNPLLAGTYRRILAESSAAADRETQLAVAEHCFYEGFVAEAIGAFAARPAVDSTGHPHAGFLTAEDLAGWRATTEAPATMEYRGSIVCKPGPWSQGPVLLQQLALLEGFDVAGTGPRPDTADYLHLVTECAKLALADREAWYGDPTHTDIPLAGLLSRQYTADRRSVITDAASLELRPGSPDGRTPRLPRHAISRRTPGVHWQAQLANGAPGVLRATLARDDTCVVVVADRAGNMVAAVPSGGWLKSSPVVPGLGFALGTRAQTMTVEPGLPNSFGPRRRPRTTLSPTLVLRDGRAWLAFGTPGGDRQDQWTLQFFLNVAEFGLGLQAGTEALAFHTDHAPSSFAPHESRPGVLTVEANCPENTIAGLRARGHTVETAPAYSLGRVCAVGAAPSGTLLAAASPRGGQASAVAH